MLPEIKNKLDSMDQSLEKLIDHLNKLGPEELHKRVADEWSPAQVFQHLHDSEWGTLGYLKKKMQAPANEVQTGGLEAKLRSFMLNRALKSKKKKFRAPKILSNLPDRPDYNALKAHYPKVRSGLRELLSSVDHTNLNKTYFKHPRAGRITFLQTLSFLDLHFKRHFEQIIERSS